MIGDVIEIVAMELSIFLSIQLGGQVASNRVIPTNIMSPDGKLDTDADNAILLSVADVRQSTAVPSMGSIQVSTTIGLETRKEVSLLAVDQYLLFSCYFPDSYKTALNNMYHMLRFFTLRPVFNHVNTPSLLTGVEQLSFELQAQDFQQKSHMWGMIGSKYIPSLLYKMKLFSFYKEQPEQIHPPIQHLQP